MTPLQGTPPHPRATSPGLEVTDLTVRYGGHLALDNITLEAPIGRLTGLIGPNGAGKTTTFNACSGLLRATTGRVLLRGNNVTRRGPAARARLGLGRTFQRMELFTSMTVAENVALGREARVAGSNPLRQQISTPKRRAATRSATAEALELFGITNLADDSVGLLSTGQRRLVELARVYAGGFDLLLLDEPSSGLDHAESEKLSAILRGLVENHDIGILLVEHDMAMVMSVCDYLYVLDFGELIFEGTAAETQASPIVRAAYLGSEEGLAEIAADHEAREAAEVV
ncbi:MAG TPA: ABC transporter ATP-binding protein [Acidimicrobiia bacterium]|nr:ABC transporter ATP-binding protein [Acidimicrobiia bacterium]